ncbi:MAG: preprotein translocase subunit SecA [Candidatus Melainabacteria bacterium GWF2_32_7]|nr:MAG: preprotein translocase subunit SecA [Candidatus Melainabacteria bacterium GWF2_32_7]
MIDLLLKILGDPNEKKIKKIQPIVDYINTLEPEISALSDDELRAKTAEFKAKLANRNKSSNPEKDRALEQEALENILPEAFAVVREAGKRALNMRHFDMQLIGGVVLHRGGIAEMRTGEGKTLVATLPAYLNALTGKGVHIVTVNDYLAKRDSEWMGKIYNFLGLEVGVVLSNRSFNEFEHKKQAYAADITYGTNNEFGFDYLRDNMSGSLEQLVQRPVYYAIVDEVDSILIDEARTPLIISGRLEKSAETYKVMAKIAPLLVKDVDYTVEEKNKNVILNEEGIDKAQELLGVKDLFDPATQYAHHLLQALKAEELYKKDVDYVIKDGEIIIVDEFTGRLMEGRRWSDGLHQAVEAKEAVAIQDETQTLASITFQNLFRLYPKLAGMTGTAMTEEAEFGKIYSLEVSSIPTNKKDVRTDYPDVIYKTEKQKYISVADEIEEMHKQGRPILVGTISIEKSEHLSSILKKRGLRHNVLNAKHHEKEAHIIAQAGRYGGITIATNMAGRGTDILLGGNHEFLAKETLIARGITPENVPADEYQKLKEQALEESYKITQEEHKRVVEAGGLHVIGTERHESRRIDNQLRGRAARQGDPGSTRFFLSLEDNLMRIFGGDKIFALMETLKVDEDMAIEAPLVSRSIQSAQKKVEAYHFDIRKHVLEYDDVMNQQRELFYRQRRKVLEGGNIYEDVLHMIDQEVDQIMGAYINPEMPLEEYDDETLKSLLKSLHSSMPQLSYLTLADIKGLKYNVLYEKFKEASLEAYKKHEEEIVNFYNTTLNHSPEINQEEFQPQEISASNNIMRSLERDILLRIADSKWIDHLHNIDMLREGIGLRAYGQKDPLIEYKREAFDMFNNMMHDIQRETVAHLFRTKFEIQVVHMQDDEPISTDLSRAAEKFIPPSSESEPIRSNGKVGRNDSCPCGSGLKYKKCCGAPRTSKI